MARNKIQFQKGLSERQFRASYGTEEQCRAALAAWRWPQGFVCPRCAGRRCCEIKERKLYQCGSCRHQVSLTAGTIFHSTKLDLIVWFQAIYLVTQTKKGISSLEFSRRLGVTQTTAWKAQKLAQVMLDREAEKPVAIYRFPHLCAGPDKPYGRCHLGGARRGGKRGRGAAGKTPFVVAVETTILKGTELSLRTLVDQPRERPALLSRPRHPSGLQPPTNRHRKWRRAFKGQHNDRQEHAVRPKHVPRYLAQYRTIPLVAANPAHVGFQISSAIIVFGRLSAYT